MISTVSNLLTFFDKGLLPAAMDPIILNCFGFFLLIFFVSVALIAKPSNAALSPRG
jgi:hypothetical protein